MKLLQVKDVFKIYPSRVFDINVTALRGVSFEAAVGETICIIGPSGSGKSTLLNILSGFEEPSAGFVQVEGLGVVHKFEKYKRIHFHRKFLGYVSQFSEQNLVMNWSVQQNLDLPFLLADEKKEKHYYRDRITTLLEVFNLERRTDTLAKNLSGGEAQKAAIATALVNQPAILIADEPTGELDSRGVESVMNCLIEANKIDNTLIIVASHSKQVESFLSKTIEIKDGTIVA